MAFIKKVNTAKVKYIQPKRVSFAGQRHFSNLRGNVNTRGWSSAQKSSSQPLRQGGKVRRGTVNGSWSKIQEKLHHGETIIIKKETRKKRKSRAKPWRLKEKQKGRQKGATDRKKRKTRSDKQWDRGFGGMEVGRTKVAEGVYQHTYIGKDGTYRRQYRDENGKLVKNPNPPAPKPKVDKPKVMTGNYQEPKKKLDPLPKLTPEEKRRQSFEGANKPLSPEDRGKKDWITTPQQAERFVSDFFRKPLNSQWDYDINRGWTETLKRFDMDGQSALEKSVRELNQMNNQTMKRGDGLLFTYEDYLRQVGEKAREEEEYRKGQEMLQAFIDNAPDWTKQHFPSSGGSWDWINNQRPLWDEFVYKSNQYRTGEISGSDYHYYMSWLVNTIGSHVDKLAGRDLWEFYMGLPDNAIRVVKWEMGLSERDVEMWEWQDYIDNYQKWLGLDL